MAGPFLMEMLQSGGKSESTSALPIGLYVRHFAFIHGLGSGTQEIISALLLPVNYFFELGFFFVVAILWIGGKRKFGVWNSNLYWKSEMLLLCTVAILLSFVKSTVIAFNDLGMRGWLLGQFILLVWAVDLVRIPLKEESWPFLSTFGAISDSKRVKDLIHILLIVGILTTVLEATSTRFWPILVDTGVTGVPNELSADTSLGERTYAGRLVYEFIRDQTPSNLIIQNNPAIVLDRPSGLYGTRQMVIGDRTAYGVPKEVLKEMSTSIAQIFRYEDATDWAAIDQICNHHSIQAIVVGDTDPLWSSLNTLQITRKPIYLNSHYAVFYCGNL
jgi:hypothetical protein